MKNLSLPRFVTILQVVAALLAAVGGVSMVHAASSWNPTLLVNTEAFETIDVGDGSTNIELRFGSSLNAKLLYDVTNLRFRFTKAVQIMGNLTVTGSTFVQGSITATGAIRTKGNLSGSTLTVDGGLNIHGLSYTLPSARGAAGTFLRENGAGVLTWTTPTVGNGSGEIMSLHPSYPDGVYFASGSSTIGQLTLAYDTTNKENYYHWTSTQAGLNEYWISVRVRVPDNFSSWDPVKPIEFRYKTGDSSSSNNALRVKLLDTTGAQVTLTGNGNLASTSWTTANISGPESAGTYTPKGYLTLLIKMVSNSSGSADAGFINFNWETTVP